MDATESIRAFGLASRYVAPARASRRRVARLENPRCATPGCTVPPQDGERFCGGCGQRLAAIRRELDGHVASGASQRRIKGGALGAAPIGRGDEEYKVAPVAEPAGRGVS